MSGAMAAVVFMALPCWGNEGGQSRRRRRRGGVDGPVALLGSPSVRAPPLRRGARRVQVSGSLPTFRAGPGQFAQRDGRPGGACRCAPAAHKCID